MKVLLTGAAGQLGRALIDKMPNEVELLATSRHGGDGLLALDLADAKACRQVVDEHRPDWVLNAGAYTAANKAETEADLASGARDPRARWSARERCSTEMRLLAIAALALSGQRA